MTETKYRLRQYNPGAWCIDELYTFTEESKKFGQQEWKTIKYPGTLAQARERLLSLVIGTDAYSDVVALKNAVRAAEHEITGNIQDYVSAENRKVTV